MALGTKYFILNRESDWQERSFIENFSFQDDVIRSNIDNAANSVYISFFDSMEPETVWHRLRMDSQMPQNAQMRVRIYPSDDLKINISDDIDYGNSKHMLLDEYMLSKDIDSGMKLNVLDELGAKVFNNIEDVVLYEFKGRYLCIALEVINYSSEPVEIKKLKIEYPRLSFVDYLPQMYRGGVDKNTFLSRFLSVFQSIYVDFGDKIDSTSEILDPKSVSLEFLDWLTEWFSIENTYVWGEERLRDLLKKSVEIYKKKGTKKALQEIIETYIGVTPIIVEQFSVTDNDYYNESKSHIENLYGSDRYTFTVIISSKETISPETYIELLRIINMMKPIDSICNLVILNNEIYLDHHCYLGINTYAAKSENIVLDNDSGPDGSGSMFLTGTQSI